MKISSMKKCDTTKRQTGFFDLGFSLALLALFGSFAYTATPGQGDRVAAQEPQFEVVANLDNGIGSVDLYK